MDAVSIRWVEVQMAGHTTIINLSAWLSAWITARQDGKMYIGLGVDSLASSQNSDGYGRSRGEKTVH